VALLRASSNALGEDADVRASIGVGDGGIEQGEALRTFAELATRGEEGLEDAREELLRAVGPAGFIEAAATVGIFNGLVRTADATGIPLDDGTRKASAGFRKELGFEEFGGARNSELQESAGHAATTAREMFDFDRKK
jgi:hypothetical protein